MLISTYWTVGSAPTPDITSLMSEMWCTANAGAARATTKDGTSTASRDIENPPSRRRENALRAPPAVKSKLCAAPEKLRGDRRPQIRDEGVDLALDGRGAGGLEAAARRGRLRVRLPEGAPGHRETAGELRQHLGQFVEFAPEPRLVQGLIRSFVQREAASAVRGFLDNVRREMETA